MQIAKKLLAVFLAALFVLPGLGVGLTASARDDAKAVNLVTNGAADYITGAQTSSVWFGNYKQSSDGAGGFNVDPVKWRVLSNADGKLFLLSDQNLDACVYYERYNTVTWETSTIRAWLNGTGEFSEENFKDSAFSSGEDAAVCVTDVSNPDSVFDDRTVPGGSDTADKVFLLSRDEAMNTAYGFTNDIEPTDSRVSINTAYTGSGGSNYGWTSAGGSADYWWLRSPGSADDRAAIVYETGQLNPGGYDVPNRSIAVRPAMNVDLGKVLFTSSAVGGKADDGLTAVRDYTGSDWKLTLLDDSRSAFTASLSGTQDGVCSVQYSGAATGENEKISAMIVNSDGVVTYYGVLGDAKTGENTVTVDLADKLHDGDKLYVFNEQANGDKKTDFSSALVDVTERSILKYDLWVGDTEVTEGCTFGEGWEYAPATNTLTLSNYRYEGEGHSLPDGIYVYSADTSRAAIVYSGSEPLNLVLEGDNAVKQTGGDLRTSAGLFSEGALTISGTGTLTAEAGEATLDVESETTYTSGIFIREKLTVTGGTVTGRGGTGTLSHNTWGIYAKGFDISGGEVYAYGGTVMDTGVNCGLQSVGTVTVSGGKLTCRGGKTPKGSIGLWTGGNMTVTGGTVDVASGEGSRSSYGIAGGRRGDVLYIGASVNSFVSVGIGYSVDDFLTVKNEIPGKGWKTVDGTDDAAEIAVNPDPGAGLWQYKKVEFTQSPYSVSISGENMTKASGDAAQTVERGSAMTDVVYTANDGYYFPEDYATEPMNGVSVTRISFTQITVSGTPTADVTLTLPSPKEMADPQTAVCRIQDAYYASIGEAVNAVTADDTVITILRDCEFDGLTEVAGHDIILESGETDVTVTLTGAMKFGKNNQSEIFTLRGNPAADTTLTIKPKLTDGTNAFRPIAIRSGNTLTVESGVVLEGSRFMTGNGGMVNVAKGATLNLNGGTIRDCGAIRGGAVYVDGGCCTIYEGRIEHCIAEQGGAVYVSYDGRCFLYEGSIENCTAKHRTIAAAANSTVNAAGGAVYAVGLLQMENSTIKNCTAEYGKGGGVYLYPEQGTFWMQDSQISGCAATAYADADLYYNDGRGGAVYVGKAKNTDAPSLCVVGSRITGNAAEEGGGVFLHEDGTMAAYKEAYISENTGGNVFVSDGAAIIAVMENSQYALTGNALIGVTTQTEPTIGAPVRFGKTKADCKEYFISDSGNADVVYDADGKALLLQCTKKEETPAATFNATGYDTGTLDGLTAGMTYAVNGGTPVTVEGTSVTFTDIALPCVITVMQPGDGVTAYDSDPQTIELTRPDAPTLEVTPIEKVGDKGSIRTTTAHQKSTDAFNWTDCDGEWTNLDGGTYYVRTKPNGTALASDAQQIILLSDPQFNVTVTATTQKEETVFTATLAEDATGTVSFTLDGNEDLIDVEDGRAELQLTLSTGSHALTAKYLGDSKYLSVTVQTSFTVACAHEWNEPTWDWTDVDNPTYTATCKLCEDGTVSDSVQSVKGDRVEATVNEDAYTPYTATVTLNGQPFTGTFNLVEKGTALGAYKEQMKQAAEDKRLPGDSDACNRLIDDAIDAIDAVTYDETKTLDENKQAVDAAANFAQLDADLAEHRAIHYAEFYADGILTKRVPYTIDTESITEPAVPDKPGHTGAWPDYVLKAGGVRIDAVYEVIMQTVDFDPNGGKGEMESVTTAWGSKITLPECGFKAPNGKEFDTWDAGNPGDEVEVKSDLTVKALWKEAPLTLTADVDPTQTGGRIAIKVPYAKRGAIAATLTASEEGVRYESSKPDVVSVDENGTIRLEKLCLFCRTATITAYSASGEKVASCVVNVRHAWWQYIIWLLFGSFWF